MIEFENMTECSRNDIEDVKAIIQKVLSESINKSVDEAREQLFKNTFSLLSEYIQRTRKIVLEELKFKVIDSKIVPENLYTSLLLFGINEPLTIGKSEIEIEGSKYRYEGDGNLFCTYMKPLEYIELNFTLTADG